MHDHDHDHDHHGCNGHCGHDHHHHHHDHVHGEDCDCGHEHIEIRTVEGMSVRQQNMLLGLYERTYLPVTRFTMTRAGEDELLSIALEPVYLGSAADTMEQVKELGAELTELEAGGLITLDYDMPLEGYPYAEYEMSDLYAYFKRTVEDGKKLPGALFDTPNLERGSMALTEAGIGAVRKMMH